MWRPVKRVLRDARVHMYVDDKVTMLLLATDSIKVDSDSQRVYKACSSTFQGPEPAVSQSSNVVDHCCSSPLTSVHEQECQKHGRCWLESSRLLAERSAAVLSFFPLAVDAAAAVAPRLPVAEAETHCYNSHARECILSPNTHRIKHHTQPCIPPGSLNRVTASAGVKAGMSPLLGGR